MNFRVFISIAIALSFTLSCASQKKKEDEKEQDPVKTLQEQVTQLSQNIAKLTDRVDSMDVRVQTTSDQVRAQEDALQVVKNQSLNASRAKPARVPIHPATGVGQRVETQIAKTDPEVGMATDEAIQRYRTAMSHFEAKRFSQAVLDFSTFVRDYADHPLAANAQFYAGESYFYQKEIKLAIEEYNRVLISYDRSSYLPDAIQRLAQCYDELKLTKSSAQARSLLKRLFPNHSETASTPAFPVTPSNPEANPGTMPSQIPGGSETPEKPASPNEPKEEAAPQAFKADDIPSAPMEGYSPSVRENQEHARVTQSP